jgi:hypothetical protein
MHLGFQLLAARQGMPSTSFNPVVDRSMLVAPAADLLRKTCQRRGDHARVLLV